MYFPVYRVYAGTAKNALFTERSAGAAELSHPPKGLPIQFNSDYWITLLNL